MGINQSGVCHLAQVPQSERRSPFIMGLLWITMVTAFPMVLVGFEWHKQGFSLNQLLLCTTLSCLLLLAYAIPATQLGARSGLGYCGLSRTTFGRWGTWLVAGNLVWMGVIWYGITAVWMAQATRDLLHVQFSITGMAIIFAFLMAFNNFFGFKGVANFARFVAAPALILWVGYTFFKSIGAVPHSVFTEPSHQSFMNALTTTSSFIIGYAVWGNEPDFWRFSKPGTPRSAIPYAIALLIGQIIFPITGWLISRTTGILDSATATTFLNNYSFGGIAVIGFLILTASYFAINDATLFGQATAIESIWSIKHRTTVTILAIVGALIAAFLSVVDSIKALDVIAALNCVILPMPTVIMITEWFLREKVFRSLIDFANIPSLVELPAIRWTSTIALFSGFAVGIATAGLIPGLESWHIGVCPIQAWLTGAFVYTVLRVREYRMETADRALILQAAAATSESEPVAL